MEYAEIGIIGGSGFYEMEGLEEVHSVKLATPFGAPSSPIVLGKLHGRSVAFLARHGLGHVLNPSEVNYRANLFALKMLDVTRIVSITAVGSLKEEIKPTDLVIPDQYVDATWKREKTFFENGLVAHVSMADPTCPDLTRRAAELAGRLGVITHPGGIYYNMEGPQFSSRGESLSYRQLGYSVIGMTQAVEAKLARELEMCFLPLAFITDYDCWHQEPVNVEMVVGFLKKNIGKAKEILFELCRELPPARESCSCGQSLARAIISAPQLIPEKTYKKLELIIGKYIPNRI